MSQVLAQSHGPDDSLSTNDLLVDAPVGLATQMRQEFNILTNGGTVQMQTGPSQATSSSAQSFAPEVNSDLAFFLRSIGSNLTDFTKFKDSLAFGSGNTITSIGNSFKVANGILQLADNTTLADNTPADNTSADCNPAGSPADTSADCNPADSIPANSFMAQETPIPRITWTDVVKKNSDSTNPKFQEGFGQNKESNIEFNHDGTATLNLPRSFLVNARKQWNSSCVGHFIGGGFAFKFVKEKAMKLWSNMGLENVFLQH